ncbi:hypothetical protein SAMN05518672_10691 [Chitinophaga sp. CF118]|uniref:hypothetical protein n=1 Tax=Chitinophaga sp. CF118 TaxID=1884367 RepID=UPI0008F2BE4E|nr:hypothetical protein [Chitinophaga sp. CF118]SFE42854.1 hypothetical protein SAMN05518672_10691 [Chitinophaga sp. CF118]
MGLLEKRALKAFQDGSYKTLTDEITAIAGYTIEFEINWDTLALDEYAAIYDDSFTKVYFTPLIAALKEITADDMGKEALKEALKKVVIKNEGGFVYGSNAYSFSNGVLTIDHVPFSNVDNITERSTELGALLMKNL